MDIIFLILSSLITISYTFSNAGPEVMSNVACVFAFYYFIKERKFDWIETPIFKMFVVLISYMLVRNMFATNSLIDALMPLMLVRYYIIGVFYYYCLSKPKVLQRFIYINSAILFIIMLDAVIQYKTEHNIFLINNVAFPRLVTFFQKVRVGYVVVAISPIIITYLLDKERRKSAIVLGVLSFSVALISYERTTTAMMLMILGVISLFYLQKKALFALSGFVIASTLILCAFNSGIYERYVSHSLELFDQASEYYRIYQANFEILRDNMYFGIGSKGYKYFCQFANKFCGFHPHNIYLHFSVEYGLIGLVLLLCFVMTILFQAKAVYYAKEEITTFSKCLFVASFAYFLSKMFPFAPSSSFYRAWVMMPCFICIGILGAYRLPKSN